MTAPAAPPSVAPTPAAPTSPAPAAAVRRRRSWAGWAAIGAGVLAVGLTMAVIAGISQLPARGLLDPAAAGPDGTRALARVLEREGVRVIAVTDRAAARAALASADSTLVWGDTAPLADDTIRRVSADARDVVALSPRSRDLRVLLGGASTGGYADGAIDPECALPEAERAGRLTPGGLFEPAAGDDVTVACYRSADGAGLLVRDDGGQRTVVVDGASLFTNEHLAEAGNAALAANLLGRHAQLVWYSPSLEDSDFADTTPSLGDLTPPWVTPTILLLIAATIAAAAWRGRRFGPLVSERLPVTVRVGETTQGRARLYARSGDPTHAADQLRIATLRRSSRTLGLGPAASAPEIADAVAARLGVDRADAHRLLIDEVIHTDDDLVSLADELRDLEHRLASHLRPERNPHE